MNATAIAAFAARTQAEFEASYPRVLTLDAVDYNCASGPWRNVPSFDEMRQTEIEIRTIRLRVTKSSLPPSTIEPGVTECEVDEVRCLITELSAGPSDPAFMLTLIAIATDIDQT